MSATSAANSVDVANLLDGPVTGQPTVSRRAALASGLAAGAAVAGVFAGGPPARAADKADPHAGHDMGTMTDHSGHGGAPKHQALIDAALHCVNKGEVCIDHCIQLLSKGDTSLKDCIRSVSAMLPMCGALAKMAALDAPRLKAFAKVCRDVCADCETECKKHQDHHALCKACAESCAACIKECDKLGA
ncbi:MAG: four-helix bundle copper-binding protein [Hyphomicrobium sp.]|nr:four-helix bundle copper-binding protein [Hyphomicrobium sp.]